MPSQRESNINDFAFDYLRNHYTTRFGTEHILVDKDEQTKQGSITQGLFSMKKEDDTLFVAALHTHHSPEITRALVKYKKKGFNVFRFALTLLTLVSVLLAGLLLGQLVSGAVAAVVLAVSVFALYSFADKRLQQRKLARLLDALKKTPADEQWLGLSVSSLTFRNNDLARQLLAMCERRGIGIITVGQRAKVILMKEPQAATCRRGDFLSHYNADTRIRKALLGDSVLRVA